MSEKIPQFALEKASNAKSGVEILPDTLKSEHLAEGVKPIMTALYEEDKDFSELANEYIKLSDREKKLSDKELERLGYLHGVAQVIIDGEEISWHKMIPSESLNAGRETYIISECNDKNKYSLDYLNCTGIVAVGESKNEEKKNISFLSHQEPDEFLGGSKDKFEDDLAQTIKELISQTKEKTLDVVIFGGNYRNKLMDYLRSVEKLGEFCLKEFGFDPVIISGPNSSDKGETSVFFDNQNRRLYLLRRKQTCNTNEPYVFSKIKENHKDFIDKWHKPKK